MPQPLPQRGAVLDLLSSDDRAFHYREIATKLGVDETSIQGLLRLLDDMAFDGVLVQRQGHRFKLGKKAVLGRGETREGSLSVNPRGFGFVSSVGFADDVFIPPESLRGAMHGDTVVVRVRSRSSRGTEGEIVEIKARGTTRIAGVLRRRGKSAWVEPDDTRVRGPVVLPREIDAIGPEGNSGNDGDAVVVSLTRFPESPEENPEGRIVAVLGRPGELNVEAAKVLVLAQIDEVHSDEAIREAEAYGDHVPEAMLEGREDLTGIPLPTIDPEDARDHDDAIWVERTAGGGYRAWIAIADVSSYVRPGTRLDDEAKKRGCSVYLPDRAIPMLPRALSSNLCSLLPDKIRLCLCVECELDAVGNVKKHRLVRGFMKSAAKLTYGGVARALGLSSNPAREPKAEAMRDDLRVALELSRILRSKRIKRGALDFDLPEAKVILDETGRPEDVLRRDRDPGVKKAYQLIEELMLLANEVVARWMVERDVPTIFRVHLPPDVTKLERLAAMCDALGVEFDLEASQDPKLLSDMLAKWADHPLASVLHMLLLRSMKQAVYDISNQGHFGLASKAYLHFTSPIRRYPDLVVHRGVHRVLLHEHVDRSATAKEQLAEAAVAASQAERKAMEVEREIVDLYRCVLMREKIGQELEGTVTAIVGSGAYVALDQPFVDVLVRTEDLGSDFYEVDDEGLRVVGKRSGDVVALGDRMRVEITDAAILRRSVYGRRIGGELARERRRGAGGREGRRGSARGGRAGDGHRGSGRSDRAHGKQGRRHEGSRRDREKSRGSQQGKGKAGKPARGGRAKNKGRRRR
jgi:ribonuclease R